MESRPDPVDQARPKELIELAHDFWCNDLDEGEECLLIMQKADWDWIHANTGDHGREEPCAPTGYQGWGVDAGIEDEDEEAQP
jgi:hypothetical protein